MFYTGFIDVHYLPADDQVTSKHVGIMAICA